eukprot:NODE_256_length_2571_cov_45.922668_g239_i0.p1 GENE.NODE_256_length_2571_cov_45.922668_g239_i0~~NODE_256_length_2571_cov_45.922668_g239_i0.p1  ORF type:complete len:592 (+),score=187.04 NODE_256_length_2571_cov_45.922668_g239_i0:730-2505(+)
MRLRVVVARTMDNKAVVTKFCAGVGLPTIPLHGDNTIPYEFETVLNMWGVRNPDEIIETVRGECERALLALIEVEKPYAVNRAQTDLIGVDVLLTLRNGLIAPIIIEVNDHDCTSQSQMLEHIEKRPGLVVGPWVSNMIYRSQQMLLEGLDILVVGLGGGSKHSIYEKIASYKTLMHMVDANADHPSRSLGQQFLHIPNLMDHSLDEQHAATIADWIRTTGLDSVLDGAITFWEDCGPLTALIRDQFGFTGPSFAAATTAKSKTKTQLSLQQDIHRDYRPGTIAYAIPSETISKYEDLPVVATRIPLPAVVKLEHGSSAYGVKLVTTTKQLHTVVKKMLDEAPTEADHGGCGLSWGCNLLLQEFVGGSEHDVDIVLFEGSLVCAVLTDNGPTRLPYFAESCAVMPSNLNQHQQDQLVTAARLSCIKLGLLTGVFNVELKLTTFGPKLIEVNARMGGFYIHKWVEKIWGVDLVLCSLMTMCNLRPHIDLGQPKMQLLGFHLFSSQHGKILTDITTLRHLKQLDATNVLIWAPYEDHVPPVEEFEEPIGSLAVAGEDLEAAVCRMEVVLSCTQLNGGDVHPSFFFRRLLEIGK